MPVGEITRTTLLNTTGSGVTQRSNIYRLGLSAYCQTTQALSVLPSILEITDLKSFN